MPIYTEVIMTIEGVMWTQKIYCTQFPSLHTTEYFQERIKQEEVANLVVGLNSDNKQGEFQPHVGRERPPPHLD